MASRAERACLDRAGRGPDDLGDLVYGLPVIIDEIEHFPVGRGKLRQTFLNNCAAILFLQERLRIVCRVPDHGQRIIIQLLVGATPEHALLRAMANSQVETCDLALKERALRQTSKKTSPRSSSASDGLLTIRDMKRNTLTLCRV
jgi:hypothetical protein